jgi:hypothetical protein
VIACRNHRALLAALAALTAFSFGRLSALAADPGEVEDLIRRGITMRRAGSDTGALPLFKRAYVLSPTPRTAAQLGLVEMALGYQLDAQRHLTEALASPRDLWIRKHRDTLEQSLQAVNAAIGEIAILGDPSGADVSVNGVKVGQLPLSTPIRVGEGPSVIEVQSPGYVAQTLSVKVFGGRRDEVVVHLQRAEVAAASSPKTPPNVDSAGESPEYHESATAEPRGAVRTGVEPRRDRDANSRTPGGALRPLAWVTAVAAAGATGVGVFETIRWRDKRDQFDHVTQPSLVDPTKTVPACGINEPGRGRQPVCQALYVDMSRAKTFAIVAYAVSGALTIGSAVLFMMSQSAGAPTTPAMACAPVGALVGVACRMTF